MKVEIKQEWLLSSGNYKCPYCNKECKPMGINYHIWKMHTNEGKQFDSNKGYKDGTRKGISGMSGKKLSKESKQKISNALKGKEGKKHSKETKMNLSINRKEKIANGLIKLSKGIGRGKSGWYRNYWCDSSYELAFVIYNIEHNIKFVRNNKRFEYEFNGEKHSYIPDFIMEDGHYVEIKGYETEQTKAKHSQFPHKLQIISGKKGIDLYLNYVIGKYGKEFINLYEDKSLIDIYEIPCELDYKFLKDRIENIPYISQILNSNINFSKQGWVKEVSILINKQPQKVNMWMKKYMLNFYNDNCFKRK